MNIGFGWIIAIGCTIGGFLWLGGHAGQLWVPAEFLIIFGAAVGTLVASNKWRNLKSLFRAFFQNFSAIKFWQRCQLRSALFDV